jgi:hypothetical protein
MAPSIELVKTMPPRPRARSRGMNPCASTEGAWQFTISSSVSVAASCASCGARRSPNPALLMTSPTSMAAVNSASRRGAQGSARSHW